MTLHPRTLPGRREGERATPPARPAPEPPASVGNQAAQRAALDPSIATAARGASAATAQWTPPATSAAGHDARPVPIHDTPASHRAAARMGVAGFSHRGEVFLARDLDAPGAPGRARVLDHEVTHALQARQSGPPASRDALERQAQAPRGPSGLLAADPEAVHGWLWIPAIIVFTYITTRSNTANAPRPGGKTYPSLTTGDYAKMIAEAAFLAAGGLVAGSIRKAGFSMVTAWGGSGAIGSIGFRAINDIQRGEFSGINAYVVDGLTGAVVGIVVGGTFHAAGNLPGLSRVRDWWRIGAEGDAEWAKLSARDKWFYEIGQKTLPSGQWEPLAGLSPVERGREIVAQQGWLRALLPRSGGFMVPGQAGTLSTGPTPMFRAWMPRLFGAAAGATGRHAFLPDWEDSSPGAPIGPAQDPGPGAQNDQPVPPAEGGAFVAPPGWDTIIVVPEGREMEYQIKSGKIGDFPEPDRDVDTGIG